MALVPFPLPLLPFRLKRARKLAAAVAKKRKKLHRALQELVVLA